MDPADGKDRQTFGSSAAAARVPIPTRKFPTVIQELWKGHACSRAWCTWCHLYAVLREEDASSTLHTTEWSDAMELNFEEVIRQLVRIVRYKTERASFIRRLVQGGGARLEAPMLLQEHAQCLEFIRVAMALVEKALGRAAAEPPVVPPELSAPPISTMSSAAGERALETSPTFTGRAAAEPSVVSPDASSQLSAPPVSTLSSAARESHLATSPTVPLVVPTDTSSQLSAPPISTMSSVAGESVLAMFSTFTGRAGASALTAVDEEVSAGDMVAAATDKKAATPLGVPAIPPRGADGLVVPSPVPSQPSQPRPAHPGPNLPSAAPLHSGAGPRQSLLPCGSHLGRLQPRAPVLGTPVIEANAMDAAQQTQVQHPAAGPAGNVIFDEARYDRASAVFNRLLIQALLQTPEAPTEAPGPRASASATSPPAAPVHAPAHATGAAALQLGPTPTTAPANVHVYGTNTEQQP
jgi:hypothetical protein